MRIGASLDLKCRVSAIQSGSLAVQDMLNGNIDLVIIDEAPAQFIVSAINELQ